MTSYGQTESRFTCPVSPRFYIDFLCEIFTGRAPLRAGVGNDPRNRHFNTVSQGEKYDLHAQLISAWVPELASLAAEARHRPWDSSVAGTLSYPTPMVDAVTQMNRPKP